MDKVRAVEKLNEVEGRLGTKKSWHDDYRDSAYIYIGGLEPRLTEGDVIAVFSQYGEIADVNMVKEKEGKSKGFCFMGYEDQRSTILAIDNLNGVKLCGRTLRVDHVRDYKHKEKEEGDPEFETARVEAVALSEDEDDFLLPYEGAEKKRKRSKKEKREKKEKKKKKHKNKLKHDGGREEEDISHDSPSANTSGARSRSREDSRKEIHTQDFSPRGDHHRRDRYSNDADRRGRDRRGKDDRHSHKYDSSDGDRSERDRSDRDRSYRDSSRRDYRRER